jgi:D-alanyl-D-alanine endopeptidase (penicillin-binding protein 7)
MIYGLRELTKCVVLIFLLLGTAYSEQLPNKKITAQSWLVTDEQGQVLAGDNTNQVRSIASISKLMTVMIVLDAKQELTQKIGNKWTRAELIQLALIKSDNFAAQMLCDSYKNGKAD